MTPYITHETIARVLVKLGIDPNERIHALDQDAEYTACRANELEQYFELYHSGKLLDDEKRVLCCFMIESLNEFAHSQEHRLHDIIANALFDDEALHRDVLDYWIHADNPDEANCWPVRKGLLRILNSRKANQTHGFSK